jgi:hypothetical protein
MADTGRAGSLSAVGGNCLRIFLPTWGRDRQAPAWIALTTKKDTRQKIADGPRPGNKQGILGATGLLPGTESRCCSANGQKEQGYRQALSEKEYLFIAGL